MNEKTIKVLGVIATVGGAALTMLSSWVGEKQMDDKIKKAVEATINK